MARGKIHYSHRLICFDIETTKDCDVWGNDLLYTWHWQAMVQDEEGGELTYYTWDNWPSCLAGLLDLCEGKRTICFVHNLSYETESIIRNLGKHEMKSIFATDTHKMLKFTLDGLLEFRCSYYLTNKSLAQCGKDVGIEKLDMDYAEKRRPGEKISAEDEEYCKRDVEIMIYKIRQLEKQEGLSFWEFPLTNTGFLRNELRHEMKKDQENRKLFLKSRMDAEQFLLCKDAFMGGYTHANYLYAGQVIPEVDSNDFGSAYPFDILVHRYPMGRWHWVKNPTWKDIAFMRRSDSMLFICEVQLLAGEGEKVIAKGANTFLSLSKCVCTPDVIEDNGRVQSATMIHTTVTCLDLEIILRAYTVKRIKVINLMWAKAGYLPDTIVKTMLKYYERKQALKNVKGEEENYMKAKNRVNSFYGMMVTSPLHDEIELTLDQWKKERLDYTDLNVVNMELARFYNSYNSFLAYQWGVFVPAWTRYHLWLDIILPNDKNIVYCDTDSAKVVNHAECKPSFDRYNAWAVGIRQARLKQLGYDIDFPDLGVFDWETEKTGPYWGFLTWGAKKYMVQDNYGMYHITVAGLSKKAGRYIRYWSDFQPGTIFAPDVSGRTISRYCSNGVWEYGALFAAECDDSDGLLSGYREVQDGGGCRIEDTTYRLSVSESYEILLAGTGDGLDEWRRQNSDLLISKDNRLHVSRPEVETEEIDFEIIRDKRNLYKVNFM